MKKDVIPELGIAKFFYKSEYKNGWNDCFDHVFREFYKYKKKRTRYVSNKKANKKGV